MKIRVMKDQPESTHPEWTSMGQKKESFNKQRNTVSLATIAEANRRAKEAIAKELESLGFSRDAIARLLNIDR